MIRSIKEITREGKIRAVLEKDGEQYEMIVSSKSDDAIQLKKMYEKQNIESKQSSSLEDNVIRTLISKTGASENHETLSEIPDFVRAGKVGILDVNVDESNNTAEIIFVDANGKKLVSEMPYKVNDKIDSRVDYAMKALAKEKIQSGIRKNNSREFDKLCRANNIGLNKEVEKKVNEKVKDVTVSDINYNKFDKKLTKGMVIVAVAIGVVATAIVLKGCDKKEDLTAAPIETTIEPEETTPEETVTSEETSAVHDIDYDEAVSDMSYFNQEFKDAGYDFEEKNVNELYFLINHDEITKEAISELMANDKISEGTASDQILEAYEVTNPIMNNIQQYAINNNDDNSFNKILAEMVKNENDRQLIEIAQKNLDTVRNSEDKEELKAIYTDLVKYNKNQYTESYNGSHEKYSTGANFVFNELYTQGMIVGISDKNVLTQSEVNALTGTSIDPSTGEKILNTKMHDLSNLMKELDNCLSLGRETAMINSHPYNYNTNTFRS